MLAETNALIRLITFYSEVTWSDTFSKFCSFSSNFSSTFCTVSMYWSWKTLRNSLCRSSILLILLLSVTFTYRYCVSYKLWVGCKSLWASWSLKWRLVSLKNCVAWIFSDIFGSGIASEIGDLFSVSINFSWVSSDSGFSSLNIVLCKTLASVYFFASANA